VSDRIIQKLGDNASAVDDRAVSIAARRFAAVAVDLAPRFGRVDDDILIRRIAMVISVIARTN
jgi:hypothetical protein